jgi:hypothetical protein
MKDFDVPIHEAPNLQLPVIPAYSTKWVFYIPLFPDSSELHKPAGYKTAHLCHCENKGQTLIGLLHSTKGGTFSTNGKL